MKILFLADFSNKQYQFTKHIKKALEKEHEVIAINDRTINYKELIDKSQNVDMLLTLHGGIDTTGDFQFAASLERLKQYLTIVKCKKVWWMPDKMWFLNDKLGEQITPLMDYAFFNDGNWVRRHKYKNAFELHMGAEPKPKGKYRKEYDLEVAFAGAVYNFRKPFLDRLRQEYGNKFKIFSDIWGQDFLDLCKSAKFIFSPPVPNDEFYWDNRIYETLSAGGCLVYPKLYGLKEEGFTAGFHYLGYKRWDDLLGILRMYSDNKEERDDVAEMGESFVYSFCTYDRRIKTLMDKVNEN